MPEHLATFALRRSGSLHFRQPQDEAAEQQEEKTTKHMGRKGQLGHVRKLQSLRGVGAA